MILFLFYIQESTKQTLFPAMIMDGKKTVYKTIPNNPNNNPKILVLASTPDLPVPVVAGDPSLLVGRGRYLV